MTNEIATIDSANFDKLSALMGIDQPQSSGTRSNLARLRLIHSGIMGEETDTKGKKKKVEVVPAGSYRLDIPDSDPVYASEVKMQVYAQREMYKRFIKGFGDQPNRFVKSLMANNLNSDLKDTDGGFNCGRKSGFIKDWNALSKDERAFINSVKRTRVLFGIATLVDPVDEQGNEVQVPPTAIIFEIDNRDSTKNIGTLMSEFGRKRLVPIQHTVTLTTEARSLPNGNEYYIVNASADFHNRLPTGNVEQENLESFAQWIKSHNEYINKQWEEKRIAKGKSTGEGDDFDEALVDEFNEEDPFIDVDDTEEAA